MKTWGIIFIVAGFFWIAVIVGVSSDGLMSSSELAFHSFIVLVLFLTGGYLILKRSEKT